MLDAELLSLLVCPLTHQDVSLASEGEIGCMNAAIEAGKLKNVAGEIVTSPVEGALIRADGEIAYPIRDDIPVMLIPQGLAISELKLGAKAASRG